MPHGNQGTTYHRLSSTAQGKEMGATKTPHKKTKIIIGDASTTSTHVKPTTIKLNPKVKGRGKGKVFMMGTGQNHGRGTTGGITSGMGGRH